QAFLSVTSTLSLAVFRDRFVLEALLAEMRQQSPALSFGPLQPGGRVAVQGPFPALQRLREFLWLKAKPLPEDTREGKAHQRSSRRREPQERGGGATETRNPLRDAEVEKQVVVLDTDIYLYMRGFLPKTLQGDGVAISAVPAGAITTVCIQAAGAAAQALRAKERIESCSVELQKVLCKERISFKEQSTAERQRYRQAWERLQPHHPAVLLLPAGSHLDVVGAPVDVFAFAEGLKR
ncbi:RBM43 protein, partial [Chaetops frenatus]|nr:RBM43 protein [Chaetops frenatus]